VLKTLQYLQHVDGLLIQRPEEPMLSAFGQMNEGLASLLLGLEGIPEIAEELMVNRDLQLLEFVGGKLHFSLVSTPGTLALIAKAKEKGLQVTCSLAAHQLSFCDEDLMNFDTNLKVSPPFRSLVSNESLKKGLLDGLIDVVVSDHSPLTIDQKKCEFDQAEVGISSIETTFQSLLEILGSKQESKLVELLAIAPAKILKLETTLFEHGQLGNFTIFSTKNQTDISRGYFKSKGYNSPFIGKTFSGSVIGTFSFGQWVQSSKPALAQP